MLVMGFRLATADWKKLFLSWQHYAVIFVKQVVFPLAVFAVLLLLPVDRNLKICLFVMSCCPVAAVVQSYAEMIGTTSGTSRAMRATVGGSMLQPVRPGTLYRMTGMDTSEQMVLKCWYRPSCVGLL